MLVAQLLEKSKRNKRVPNRTIWLLTEQAHLLAAVNITSGQRDRISPCLKELLSSLTGSRYLCALLGSNAPKAGTKLSRLSFFLQLHSRAITRGKTTKRDETRIGVLLAAVVTHSSSSKSGGVAQQSNRSRAARGRRWTGGARD